MSCLEIGDSCTPKGLLRAIDLNPDRSASVIESDRSTKAMNLFSLARVFPTKEKVQFSARMIQHGMASFPF